MDAKTSLIERIERERAYLDKQEVGSKEYDASMERMNVLEEKLSKIEQSEDERKHRSKKEVSEWVKFGLSSVVVPVSMSLLILKWEETGSVTTALRSWITNNVPRR